MVYLALLTTIRADVHTLAASSRLKWCPRQFKWTCPFHWKKKSGFCTCAITFQLASTYCDKLQYKIKINYITLKCIHTHTHTLSLTLTPPPHTTARVVTVQQLRSIHCIILMLSSCTCKKLWIWRMWKQNGFRIWVFWDVMPWQWVSGSCVTVIMKGNLSNYP
jgi:hypothetical protein